MEQQATLSSYIADAFQGRADLRILHFNAKDLVLKEELSQRGFSNFLGIAMNKPVPGLYWHESKKAAHKNNAELLFLDGADFETLVNAFRSRAEWIIYRPNQWFNKFTFRPLLAMLQYKNRRWDFSFENFEMAGRGMQRVIVFKRRHIKKEAARHYLSPDIRPDDFFGRLNKEEVPYVVLRWHEEIPFTDIDEDIDLLVSDEAIGKVHAILDERIGIVPFDVYSESGLTGSGYREMAYYRPHLAREIVLSRELWNSRFYIPDCRHRFLSLMYHAVYHKGEESGLPIFEGGRGKRQTEHDYPRILKEMAKENGVVELAMNLTDCHRFLKQQGWSPATDTIRKLSQGNGHWLESIVQADEMNFEKNGELMVFVIREWASEKGLNGYIADWFENAGLNVVKLIELEGEERKKAAQNLRGGNWGKGPWPVSGGEPAALLIVYDYHPKALKAKERKKYPYVSNEHYLLKEKLRKEINSNLCKEQQANALHSSDDEIEALEYIHSVVPQVFQEVEETIRNWDEKYRTKEKVIKDISENKRRAKVEIIDFNGVKAVKKTYKAGKERFLNREKYVYGELSNEREFIPKLLDSGDNYIIIPYFETVRFSNNERAKNKMLKKHYKEEIYGISDFFYHKGCALIDFHPGNLLITREGLKVIDFEFLYHYDQLPESSLKTFDLLGFPVDFEGDKPYGIKGAHRKKVWKKILN
ncbi:hypothetical protein [Planococcus citreus]|uniref:Protein kinase domain-containing protein n=1 Tax=Planococcus citreus TaxID=1373 RepID=A0A497YLG0_9BACL|nr:hypothetical protein [Planococcus citreus]RLJ90590.1 hypothetical protein DFR62_0734 [Planococcus citreus]